MGGDGREFRAIVIGIEEYDDPKTWKTLAGVRQTAARVARAVGTEPLPLPQGGNKDEAPRALKAAIKGAPERATLFLHWIGHGAMAGDQHYLVCRNSPGPGELDGLEAMPSGELGRVLANSRAERIVVVLDTCYSGQGAGNLAQRYKDSLAKELSRDGWERVACFIASSHPLDKVVAGRFSEALAAVLEDPDGHLKWTRAEQYIDPERLASAAKTKLSDENKPVDLCFLKQGLGWDIIPNPRYRREAGNADIETRRWLEGVFGERAHFSLAARGIEMGETGYFFTGRKRSQVEILDWLNHRHDRLLIVTGPPGSGKSALLGRLVTLSVPGIRAEIKAEGGFQPGDPVPPENAFDVAVHAKGKSVFEVAAALGWAAGLDRPVVDQPGIADVIAAIEKLDKPRTMVIDALDEASSGQADRIANELIGPLAAMPHVRLLVGTRRSLDGRVIPDSEGRHSRLLRAFKSDPYILDLENEPETKADIAGYVERRLRAAPENQRGDGGWIAEAGRRVADASQGSFLYARLVARSLEARPGARLETMPADAAQAFVDDIAGRFPDDVRRVTDMLRALAFGLGLGLSRAVWAPVATALGTSERRYADDDVAWMLRHVGSYIVEMTVVTDGIGQAVYRLIHQSLADQLQSGVPHAHEKIVQALTRGLDGEAWLAADLYLRRHIVAHAILADGLGTDEAAGQLPLSASGAEARRLAEQGSTRADELERLLATPGVLAVAEPASVLATRPHLRSPGARQIVGLYLLAAGDLPGVMPAERWALLHLKALTQGAADLSSSWRPPGSSRFAASWARTRPITPHLVIGRHESWVRSVALGQAGGRAVVVSGGDDGTVRLWDAEGGTPIGVPLRGHKGWVFSIALGQAGGRAVVVSGGGDGTVRLWDAEGGTPIGAPLDGHKGSVLSVALGQAGGRAVVVSGSDDGTVRLWDAERRSEITSVPLGEQSWCLVLAGDGSVAIGTDRGIVMFQLRG